MITQINPPNPVVISENSSDQKNFTIPKKRIRIAPIVL